MQDEPTKTIWYQVATAPLNVPSERFAVLRIDTEKRVGDGCEATVHSCHSSLDEAEALAEHLDRGGVLA